MELRTIDFSQKHFECQGRKFFVKESLSFARYVELQKLNLEFGFSGSFFDIYNNVKIAFDFLNQMKPAEGAVVLHNILNGIVSLDDKDIPAFKVCALFIDEEGEDSIVYDEGKMREKIECWGAGGLDPLPFFQLAADLTPRWRDVYKMLILDGSHQEKKKGNTYIEKDRMGLDKNWNDLIYSICDGKVVEMQMLRKYDIMDFFSYVDNKSKK